MIIGTIITMFNTNKEILDSIYEFTGDGILHHVYFSQICDEFGISDYELEELIFSSKKYSCQPCKQGWIINKFKPIIYPRGFKKFECPFCQRRFKSVERLKFHMEVVCYYRPFRQDHDLHQ